MQVSVLASGSKGNATLVAMNGAKILVDAGISATRIKKALAKENLDAADLDAILVTHEHTDHVAGLATLAKWYRIPVYSRRKTLASLPPQAQRAIAEANGLPLDVLLGTLSAPPSERVAEAPARYGTPDEGPLRAVSGPFRLAGLRITPIPVPHDAADPVGYRIEGDGVATVCTDLGFVTQAAAAGLDGSDVLVLEANHDPTVLKNGRYPWPLKRRILGSRGHLANADAAWTIAHLKKKPRAVFLAHLSQENNTPELAYATVSKILQGQGLEIPIHVTKQDEAVRLQ